MRVADDEREVHCVSADPLVEVSSGQPARPNRFNMLYAGGLLSLR